MSAGSGDGGTVACGGPIVQARPLGYPSAGAYACCASLVDRTFYAYTHVRPVAVSVAGPALIMGLLNVSMMWIEVAEASTRSLDRRMVDAA